MAVADHIYEFVESYDPSDDAAAEAFRQAVEDHFTPEQSAEHVSVPNEGMRRTVVTFEVLWSLDSFPNIPPDFTDLSTLMNGECSVAMVSETTESVSRARMAVLLEEQGSDPEFLLGDFCRVEGCFESLDDGEGWNGFCGDHADVVEGHVAEDEEDRHVPGSRPDCPVCTGEVDEREVTD
mgnify:CR=1 FL=1